MYDSVGLIHTGRDETRALIRVQAVADGVWVVGEGLLSPVSATRPRLGKRLQTDSFQALSPPKQSGLQT